MKQTSSTVEFEISVIFDILDVETSRVLLKLLVEVLWLFELLWTFCFIAWYNHWLLWRLNFQLIFELWGFCTPVMLLNLKLLFWTALKLVVDSMKQSSPAMPFETELTENTFLLSIVVWSLSNEIYARRCAWSAVHADCISTLSVVRDIEWHCCRNSWNYQFKDYLATYYHSVFNAIITVMHKSYQQL